MRVLTRHPAALASLLAAMLWLPACKSMLEAARPDAVPSPVEASAPSASAELAVVPGEPSETPAPEWMTAAAGAPDAPEASAPPEDEGDYPHHGRLSAVGESCAQRACAAGAVCVGYGDDARCSEACDPTAPFCASGALCLALSDPQEGVCASYGRGQEGTACATATDCAPTLACVSVRGAPPACVHACDFAAHRVSCPSRRECAISAEVPSYGICEAHH
jgi:hypothetical protein